MNVCLKQLKLICDYSGVTYICRFLWPAANVIVILSEDATTSLLTSIIKCTKLNIRYIFQQKVYFLRLIFNVVMRCDLDRHIIIAIYTVDLS